MFELTPPWQEVLNYWFEDGLSQDWPASSVTRKWFRASAGDDAEIDHRFGAYVEAGLQQELVDWERQPLSRLALILVLDQFPAISTGASAGRLRAIIGPPHWPWKGSPGRCTASCPCAPRCFS